ncbi:MAG: Mur ligase domain-containing protein [Verrucomicrobiota bacterium]|nr:Mur ligase domain-containing protein [Verrucomicrobiota bacterium]
MDKNKRIHFIGIGGVGMSGMAEILSEWGYDVSGSDMKDSSVLSRLSKKGLNITIGHFPKNIPVSTDIVVFSSAITIDNPEYIAAEKRGLTMKRRGEFLADIVSFYKCVVAIAGSHGKTTTTAMLSHILREREIKPGYLVGGNVFEWNSPASAGNGEILVTEVDESDGTQAYIKSDIGVILNVEDDHCWNLGGEEKLYQCFKDFADSANMIITVKSPKTTELFETHKNALFIDSKDISETLRIPQIGFHNRLNAYTASVVAEKLGVSLTDSIQALKSFPGVERRLMLITENLKRKLSLFEDYAHHPTEVRAAVSALRSAFPKRSLIIVFQPHRYERIARYAKEFAQELSKADFVYITMPFAAWLNDSSIADPRVIADNMSKEKVELIDFKDNPTKTAEKICRDQNNAIIAVLGAGSVTELIPYLAHFAETSHI